MGWGGDEERMRTWMERRWANDVCNMCWDSCAHTAVGMWKYGLMWDEFVWSCGKVLELRFLLLPFTLISYYSG